MASPIAKPQAKRELSADLSNAAQDANLEQVKVHYSKDNMGEDDWIELVDTALNDLPGVNKQDRDGTVAFLFENVPDDDYKETIAKETPETIKSALIHGSKETVKLFLDAGMEVNPDIPEHGRETDQLSPLE
jgi:hypothetical protein